MSSSRNFVNALFFSCALLTVTAGAQAQSLNETVNQPPVANPVTVVVGFDEATELVLEGSDEDGDELSYELLAEPVFGVLSGDLPNLTYTPLPGFTGVDGLSFKVNDGQADSEAAEVRLEVAQSVCSLYPIALEAARLEDVLSGSFT